MITVAKNAGFCFGVKRATDTIEELIKNKSQGDIICTLGKLIHNQQYIEFLEKNGVLETDVDGAIALFGEAQRGKRVTIVIRAHGIENDIQEKLQDCAEKNENFKIIDCTCPYVKKIHKIAFENSSDKEIFVLIGQREHPEVKSIMSYVNNQGYIFGDAQELEDFLKVSNLGEKTLNVAAQTTQKLTEWEKSEKIIKKYCTNANFFDTICSVTEKRQTEAMELSRGCDLMFVIGGRDSSNTAKLSQVCKSYCHDTYWIETSLDIMSNNALFEKIRHANKIGITAGASTPDSIIQEVKEIMENQNENFAQMLDEEYAKKAKYM